MFFKNSIDKDKLCLEQIKFLEILVNMLDELKPPLLDINGCVAEIKSEFDDKTLFVTLPHIKDKDIDIEAMVNKSEIIVSHWASHEHFYADDQEQDSDNWLRDAVGFIAEFLLGNFEIHTTYKGAKETRVDTFYINENGEKEMISSMGFFSFNLLNPFLKKKVEVRKVSFFSENVV